MREGGQRGRGCAWGEEKIKSMRLFLGEREQKCEGRKRDGVRETG